MQAAVELIDEGNTIPFIARYRKEATGSMDDQKLRQLEERLSYLRKLDDQKAAVANSITEQGAMTDELAAALEKAATLAEVEDIYRPYKPKRKTRASMAKGQKDWNRWLCASANSAPATIPVCWPRTLSRMRCPM